MKISYKTKLCHFLIYATCILWFTLVDVVSFAQCTDDGNLWNKSWVSCNKTTNPNPAHGNTHWIIYEFDQPQSISESYIWNANKAGESINGAKDVIIDYSTNGFSWTELGSYTFPKANEANNYPGFEGPNFGGIFIKKILITILNTYGNTNCASLSEVQFRIDENACYGAYDACGECNGTGPKTWYADADNDGLGSSVNPSVENCNQPNGYVANADDYCDNGLVGWQEVATIFKENGCTGCHSDNALGGLNLTTYENAIRGGNKCGSNIFSGTVLANIININGYDGCGTAIGFPSMNERVGGNIDPQELGKLQAWVNQGALKDCNCQAGAPDADNDGYCNVIDNCPNFNNNLIGSPCNDGVVCTINDVWTADCVCAGTKATDTDNDGVCDFIDLLPNNPCSADGTIDGNEPGNWIALPTNDCDLDLVSVNNGDQVDFDACIDNNGELINSTCACENSFLKAGANYIGHNGVGGIKPFGSGLPDGNFTGAISGSDYLDLEIPHLIKGEDICFTVSFSDPNGLVSFDINFRPYTFLNTSGLVNEPQEFCITNVQSGPVNIRVTEVGVGYVILDGASYAHCPCSPADPEFERPNCNCAGSNLVEDGTYLSAFSIGNANNANGSPDGLLTNGIYGTDSLNLQFTNTKPNSEICISLGFNNVGAVASIEMNEYVFYANNITADTLFMPQQFCFPNQVEGTVLATIKEVGYGGIKVDGSIYKYCDIDCTIFEANIATTNESTFLAKDGMATINLTYGTAPYNYVWSNGSTTSLVTNLSSGSYFVEVKDANNCKITKNVQIETANCPEHFIQTNFEPLPSMQAQVKNYIQSNGFVNANENVSFKAKDYIELNSNFEVLKGAEFEAIIEVCE